jgi:hypothetical protein
MSNRPNDNFQDPKPFNTVSLINQRNHIKELIDFGQAAKAFTEMCSLVCEFDLNTKDTDMIKVKADLIKNWKASYLTSAVAIDYFDKINIYMNETYCRGFKAPMGEDFFPTLDSDENAEQQ